MPVTDMGLIALHALLFCFNQLFLSGTAAQWKLNSPLVPSHKRAVREFTDGLPM